MKYFLIGVVSALTLSWCGLTAAQTPMTGDTLLQLAASVKKAEAGTARAPDYSRAMQLAGFAFGVVSTLEKVDRLVCLPEGTHTGQYVRILIQYLETNPSELHKEATDLAILAFRKAFPCR